LRNTPNNNRGEQDLSQVLSIFFDIANALDNSRNKQQHRHLLLPLPRTEEYKIIADPKQYNQTKVICL
jgi:hypothetical protein